MPHSAEIAPLPRLGPAGGEQVAAQVAAQVAGLVAGLVNEVYAATEGPMWRPGGQRTTPDEVAALAAAGQLHGCFDDRGALGVVWTAVSGDRGELGMLAVRPTAGGRGLGTALVRYAEGLARDAGATVMELVVARPRDFELPAKQRLGAWYPRLGYRLVETLDLADVYPHLLAEFVVPAVVDRYEHRL